MSFQPARTRLRRLLPLAVAAAVGVAAGAGAYALTNKHSGSTASSNPVVVPAQPASSTSTVDSLTQLYKQDVAGVVDITVTSSSGGGSSGFPFGAPQQGQKSEAEGTGFVIDTKGDIMTAEHVVANATSIKV